MENPIKMDDLGVLYHYFRKQPYKCVACGCKNSKLYFTWRWIRIVLFFFKEIKTVHESHITNLLISMLAGWYFGEDKHAPKNRLGRPERLGIWIMFRFTVACQISCGRSQLISKMYILRMTLVDLPKFTETWINHGHALCFWDGSLRTYQCPVFERPVEESSHFDDDDHDDDDDDDDDDADDD